MQIAVVIVIAVVAIGVVLMPLLKPQKQSGGARLSEQALDNQVARYRSALKAGTICERCLTANPAGSKFCSECGRLL